SLSRRCPQRSVAMLDIPFPPFCALLGSLGALCVALVGSWCQHWRGGFSLDGGPRTFNWHPVLMVTGMVVLYGAAALVYRIPSTWSGPKLPWKLLHAALALGGFVLTVLGLAAVFRFHDSHGTPNMYSLHSWMGLATVLLFSCQDLGGSGWDFGWILECPAVPPCRAWFPPHPSLLGRGGFRERLGTPTTFPAILLPARKNGTTEYKLLPAEAVFANTLGMLILLFGVLVLGALARPSWKRPDPDSLDSRQ
ncbi:CYAC3 protein, partial [Scytalopus superciliaris]|nr:CYAC3 protein [Scytalopus superciliaris]